MSIHMKIAQNLLLLKKKIEQKKFIKLTGRLCEYFPFLLFGSISSIFRHGVAHTTFILIKKNI